MYVHVSGGKKKLLRQYVNERLYSTNTLHIIDEILNFCLN